MFKSIILAAAAAVIMSGTAAAEGGDLKQSLADGKAAFEKSCKFCHSLERSLTKVKARDEWMLTVERMVTYGAPLNTEKRENVVTYLTARSNFQTSCNRCHNSVRVLEEPVKGKDWQATVARMSKHIEELAAKDPEMQLSKDEVSEIGAFLSVVIPED